MSKKFLFLTPFAKSSVDSIAIANYYDLPITGGLCFGWEDVFAALNAAWNSDVIRICTIIAFGGVGKT